MDDDLLCLTLAIGSEIDLGFPSGYLPEVLVPALGSTSDAIIWQLLFQLEARLL